MKLKIALIALIALISSSCSTTTIPVQVALQLPPELILVKIKGADLQCLTDEVYQALKLRDISLRARVDTLKDIIKSTQQ